jgi:hypothetical protein
MVWLFDPTRAWLAWRASGINRVAYYRSVWNDLFEKPARILFGRLPSRVAVSEALIMTGQLP